MKVLQIVMICDGIKRYYTMSKRQNDDDAQHSSAITSAEEKFTVPIGRTLLVLLLAKGNMWINYHWINLSIFS